MTENDEEQPDSRTVTTQDLLNREELVIEYFPATRVVRINGDTVTRSPPLEDKQGETVFHRASDNRIYTVTTDSLSGLHL